MPKCPVCKTEYENADFCSECGFDQLNTVFINIDEADNWRKNVVEPYRHDYWLRMKYNSFKIEGTTLIRYIGDEKSVVVPFGITEIDAYAFSGTACREITHIELPSTVHIIRRGAFSGCRKLKHITLPSAIDIWEKRTFADCHSLEYVELPEGITELDGTFYMCANLSKLEIPSTVNSIKGKALVTGWKTGLDISFRSSNPDFYLQDGFLIQKSTKTLIRYVGKPTEVLRTPSGLERIDAAAFQRCENTLKTVWISEGVKTLSRHIFFSCFDLETIVLPSTVTDIEENMFLHCPKLRNVLVEPTNKNYRVDGNYLIDNKNQKIIQVIDRTITEAIIPNGVQEIGRMVFDYCEHLEKVYMPNSLTTIRSAAFQMCEALADVKLSNNLKTIENGAFTGTKMLIDIVIPASVTNFGEHIFIMEEQPKRIFCEHYSWQLPQDINWTGCKGTIYAKGTWHYDNGRPVPNN